MLSLADGCGQRVWSAATEDAEAFTETTGEELPPPHPERNDAKVKYS